MRRNLILTILLTSIPLIAGTGLVTTVAGNGTRGYGGLGGPATSAPLNTPAGICFDPAGNLYIADYNNAYVVRVDAATGIITLVAGTGQFTSTGDGGPASLSTLNGPMGVAIDAAGNLFISEYWGNRVRRVDAVTQIITTVAGNGNATPSGDGGPGSAAGVQAPRGLATDAAGNLFIAETNDVRRVDAPTGIITTVVPSGPGGVNNPTWIAFDRSGSLLIHDGGVSLIKRFNPSTGIVDVFAGNGNGAFDGDGKQARNTGIGGGPVGIAVDLSGNVYLSSGNVYLNDNQSRLRRIDGTTGMVQTIAGNGYPINPNSYPNTPSPDGQPANLTQITPVSVAVGPDGSVYFVDDVRVRRVSLPSPLTYTSTTLTISPPNPAYGANVTFTATPVAINGASVPTGTVSLFETTYGMSPMGTPLPLVNGSASITVQAPSSGNTNYQIVASYSGDSLNAASLSPVTPLIVGGPSQVATHVIFNSQTNPSLAGMPVNILATILTQYQSAYTPTGSLQVMDNGGLVLTVPVAGTTVPFSLSLSNGTHQITATYSGDSHFLSGGSDVLTQIVGKVTPNVTISSSSNPAIIGGPLTFTATVSPASATGSVDFVEYAAPAVALWGTAPIVNGIATLTFAALPAGAGAGTHNIQANYNGDASFNSASSASLVQQIVKAMPAVSLSSSMNPGVTGVQFPITATVSAPTGPLGQPTGSVQLMDGATSLGTVSLQSGQAQFTVSFDTAGTHLLSAVYSGDRAFAASTSLPLSEVVKSMASFSAVINTPNPSVAGSPVSFTAYLVQTSATGTVEFLDASATPAVSLGVATLSSGVASLTTSSLSVGTHTITARYSGDANFISSATNVTQVVKTATTVSLAATPASVVYGATVQLSATVAPGAGTGTVQFSDGATVLGTSAVNSGVAVLAVPSFTAGTHNVTAVYSGDSAYGGSTSAAAAVTVNKATPAVSISSSQNPSPSYQSVVFTIALTPATVTGNVQLLDGSTVLATVTAGTTTASVTLFTGTHIVTAVYSGDLNYNAITSAAVSQLITTTTITSLSATPASSTFGQAVQLTATVAPLPPSGTVTFISDATTLGSVPLAGGTASFAVSTLPVGGHTITAVYSGDGAAYLGSTSAVSAEFVAKAATTATLSSSANPATFGQAVTLTAVVSPAGAGGTAQFFDGATSIGTVSLASGTASLSTSALGTGSHALTVVYSGDGNYASATSAVLSQTINKIATTATMSSSANPATFGQAVTLSAAISPAAAGGTAQFFDGATSLGTVSLASGAATLTTSALETGSHALTVVYSGDGNYSTATSAVLTETINKIATTATLSSSANPATSGQAVTLTAAVSPAAASGTMQFFDGATSLGTVSLASGAASLTTSALGTGSHALTVVYSGDSNYVSATSAVLGQTINKIATTATLSSSANPATFGQAVTLTAAVSPAAASGSAQFFDGATSLGTVSVASGAASLTTSALGTGSHALTVVYSGDSNYASTTSAVLTQIINKIATTATLSSSANPATFGQAVTLTAAISPAAASGTAQFFDGAALLGTATVTGGTASLSTSALGTGSHALTVAYSGDANYSTATSATLTESVNKAATATALTSSLNPSNVGQAVTFTAVVLPATATGTVQFLDVGTVLGTATVAGGQASLAITSLTAGSHTINAIYTGDANYLGSTSAVVTQTVIVPIPGAPTNLIATSPTGTQINLAWTASPTSGVTYNVYSSTNSGFTPSSSNRIAAGVVTTSYSHTGLSASSTHYYVVKAQNSAGESAASNQANATTQPGNVSCHVGYTLPSHTNVAFVANITIKNNTNAAINGWNLTWTWAGNQQITQAANANYTQTGQDVLLTNVASNGTIGIGATLNGISFNASYSGPNTNPSAFFVNGMLCK